MAISYPNECIMCGTIYNLLVNFDVYICTKCREDKTVAEEYKTQIAEINKTYHDYLKKEGDLKKPWGSRKYVPEGGRVESTYVPVSQKVTYKRTCENCRKEFDVYYYVDKYLCVGCRADKEVAAKYPIIMKDIDDALDKKFGMACHTGFVETFKKYNAGFYAGGWTRGARLSDTKGAVIDLTGTEYKGNSRANDRGQVLFARTLKATQNREREDSPIISLPIPDFSVPSWTREDWQLIAQDIDDILKSGMNVKVACTGGHGRTGLFAAIVASMLMPDDAEIQADPVGWIRRVYCASAVETATQERYVYAILNMWELRDAVKDYGYNTYTTGNYIYDPQAGWVQDKWTAGADYDRHSGLHDMGWAPISADLDAEWEGITHSFTGQVWNRKAGYEFYDARLIGMTEESYFASERELRESTFWTYGDVAFDVEVDSETGKLTGRCYGVSKHKIYDDATIVGMTVAEAREKGVLSMDSYGVEVFGPKETDEPVCDHAETYEWIDVGDGDSDTIYTICSKCKKVIDEKQILKNNGG